MCSAIISSNPTRENLYKWKHFPQSLISHYHVWDCSTNLRNPQNKIIHIHMLCFAVAARVQNASDPVTYNLWRAGAGNGMCAVCPHAGDGEGGGLSETVSICGLWAFCSIIRIQHTACKMQQMGSSLEWQLRVRCHTELQLACQSNAAPRSFLYSHIFHLSCPTPFIFSRQSFIWPRLHSFPHIWPQHPPRPSSL